ncbi:MAG: hypothetical protein HYZ53_29410 [Planctomycetes bacterium]|nr:hypothetical protein [Planctomycetota bacterium]
MPTSPATLRGGPRGAAATAGAAALALVAALACTAALRADDDEDEPPLSPKQLQAKKELVYKAFAGQDADWTRMGKARAGDWLARFKEPGETFDEYREEMEADRPKPDSRILLVPLGDFAKDHADLLEAMREYGEAFFATRTEVAPAHAFPARTWVERRGQYNADRVLDALAKEVPPGVIAYVAFTDQDLFSSGLNFVFGLGSEGSRVGVYSTQRLGEPRERLLWRTLQLMNHEVGHIFGVDHCIFYECSMNGSNSLDESDRHPIHFCPLDEKKLSWFFGFELPARDRRLIEYYRKHGLGGEAEFLERVLKHGGK